MMTDTHTTTEGAPSRDDRLERPVEGRVVAGVAEGLSRRLGITPGWVRLGFVIAALFGGSGILAYIAGWLLMPDERDDESIAARYIGTVGNWSSWVGVGLIGVAALIIIDRTGVISGELLFAGVLIALGVLLYNGQLGGHPPDTPEPTGAADVDTDEPPTPDLPESDGDEAVETPPTGAALDGPEFGNPEFENPEFAPSADGDVGAPPPPPPPPPSPVQHRAAEPRPPRQRREPSYLGRFTIATALLVVGGLAAYDASTTADVAYGVYMASFMIVVGAGLLVGAWVGRARWLIIPGLILLPAFVVVSVLPGGLTGDIGERSLSGVQVLEAGGRGEMAIGDFLVDLRDIPLGTEAEVIVSLGIGQLVVVVPDDRTVRVNGEVGIGQLLIDRNSTGGLGVERSRILGAGEPQLTVHADLGIGQLEVRRLDTAGFGSLSPLECEPSSPDWPFAGELVCTERTQ